MNEKKDVKQLKERLEQLETEYLQAVLDSTASNPLKGRGALRAVKIVFKKNGILLDDDNINYASKNTTVSVYWVNPQFDVLTKKWHLVLNDWIKRQLHLLIIPANSITKEELIHRKSPTQPGKYVINIGIKYNDPSFTDHFSGYQFSQYLNATVDY